MSQISQQIRIRVAITILFGSLFISALFSTYYYYTVHAEQKKFVNKSIQQLTIIIQKTAANAAYLDHQNLALELVQGLAKNDLIMGARITSKSGLDQKSEDFSSVKNSQANNELIIVDIKSPFDGRHIGELMILPDKKFIDQKTIQRALKRALSMIILTLFIAIFVFILISRVLTEPLKKIATHLHKITPGSEDRIICPDGHEKNEIGGLSLDINYLLQSVQNIMSSERELHVKTKQLEKQFRLLVEEASAGIILLNQDNQIIISNRAFKALIQNTDNDNKQQMDITQFCSKPKQIISTLKGLRENKDLNTISYDFQLSSKESNEGKLVHGLFSKITSYKDESFIEGIIYDVTERAQREGITRFEADHDSLTGLYNRRAGVKNLKKGILQAIQKNSIYAIFLVDLDKFKPINDQYGHDAGDQVLKIVSDRMKNAIREDDIIIRWGGDEFIIGFSIQNNISALSQTAKKLVEHLSEPISITQTQECSIGASIGIAYYPDNGIKLDQLIQAADSAMYMVKNNGRNAYQFYSEINSK